MTFVEVTMTRRGTIFRLSAMGHSSKTGNEILDNSVCAAISIISRTLKEMTGSRDLIKLSEGSLLWIAGPLDPTSIPGRIEFAVKAFELLASVYPTHVQFTRKFV